MPLSSRRFLRGGGALLGVAHLVEATLPFARNIALARLLEPHEFALSLALAAVYGIAEMASDIGLPQYALRCDPSDRAFRNTLHSLALMRSFVIGTLIAAAAVPLAIVLDVRGSEWSFAVVGLAVALKGAASLGVRQVTRDGRFAPEAIAVIMSQIGWSVAVVALSLFWGDHRAMAAGLIVYVVTYVLVTNLVLPMRFSFAWDPTVARDAVRYGAPLVPNGIALAVTSLSDRLLVGGLRGLDALALYGPLVATAMLPRASVLRYIYSLVLPSMVRLQQQTGAFQAQMAGWMSAVSLLAAAMGLGFMCLADPVIALVFGARYAPGPQLASLMALLLACRLVVAFPVPAAMARGRTWFVTGSSLIAAVALAPAALALGSAPGAVRSGLAAFLATLIIVETIGIALILLRARRAFPDVTAGMLRSAALVGVVVTGAAAACQMMGAEAWTQRLLPCGVFAILAVLVFGRDLRALLRGRWSQSG